MKCLICGAVDGKVKDWKMLMHPDGGAWVRAQNEPTTLYWGLCPDCRDVKLVFYDYKEDK
jgi:hypothetical protein